MFINCLLDGDYTPAGLVDQEARPWRLAADPCAVKLAALESFREHGPGTQVQTVMRVALRLAAQAHT